MDLQSKMTRKLDIGTYLLVEATVFWGALGFRAFIGFIGPFWGVRVYRVLLGGRFGF